MAPVLAVRPFVRRLRAGVVAFLLDLLVLAGASSAHANGSLRCASRIVDPGASSADVYALCGEPTARAATTELVTVRVAPDVAVTRPVALEEWTYDRGPKQFIRVLFFRDGELIDVDEAGYGH